jgi:hypothetical protein
MKKDTYLTIIIVETKAQQRMQKWITASLVIFLVSADIRMRPLPAMLQIVMTVFTIS